MLQNPGTAWRVTSTWWSPLPGARGGTMTDLMQSLIWMTQRIAVNPRHVVAVFCGNGGEIVVTMSAGDPIRTTVRELSDAGARLCCPPRSRPPTATADRVATT